jgi:CRISPR/Cas system CSM-associated protein Csm3 (group 7 of RAMP superfamily)
MNSKEPSHAVHKAHCLACRLFGSLGLRGRASVRDLFPWSSSSDMPDAPGDNYQQANRLELRHGVCIDRISGSVKHGPFDQELVPSGVSFWGDIALENYQVWQLGLLAEAFTQINDGIAQLGMSKSRGLGVARVHVERIVHEQTGTRTAPLGAGDLATPEERDLYGLTAESRLPAAQGIRRGLATRFEVTQGTDAWLHAGLQALGDLQ